MVSKVMDAARSHICEGDAPGASPCSSGYCAPRPGRGGSALTDPSALRRSASPARRVARGESRCYIHAYVDPRPILGCADHRRRA